MDNATCLSISWSHSTAETFKVSKLAIFAQRQGPFDTQAHWQCFCPQCRYGPEQGYGSFRTCLAEFLSKETGYTVADEELLITAGVYGLVQSGLWLDARHCSAPMQPHKLCGIVTAVSDCSLCVALYAIFPRTTVTEFERVEVATQLVELTGMCVHCVAGVSHGLDLACRHLSSPGDHIIVEQPTYFLAGSILRQSGLQPVSSAG
jgi:hypothetical protein